MRGWFRLLLFEMKWIAQLLLLTISTYQKIFFVKPQLPQQRLFLALPFLLLLPNQP